MSLLIATFFSILGEFGIVYKGQLKEAFHKRATETVAVKTLKGMSVFPSMYTI